MDNIWETLRPIGADFVQNTGLAIVRTIAFLVLGLIVIKIVQTIVRSASLRSRRLDNAAATFVISIVTVVLYIALVIVLVTSLGFSTAGIIAAFSAVALAVALALKDSLGSLANGVIIIFTKPFKKGDYVKIGQYDGLVQDIRLFNTKILTYSNEEIIIPNSEILSSEMVNYSSMPLRRIAVDVPVPYGCNAAEIKEILLNCAKSLPYTVNSPAPSAILLEYGDSALKFSVRIWTTFENYWDALYGLNESLYTTLLEHGICIQVNRMDVRVLQAENGTPVSDAAKKPRIAVPPAEPGPADRPEEDPR